MAKHRTPEKQRARKAVAAAATAAGLSGALVLGQALGHTIAEIDVDLANTVLGVGGRSDSLGVRIPDKLGDGQIGRPEWNGEFEYLGIQYPADALFEPSMVEGAPTLTAAIFDPEIDGPIQVTSYSQGTLVAEQVKRNLATDPNRPAPTELSFLYIASPYLPNGGLFARFPGFRIPGVLPEFGPAEPTPYAETFVTNMYDPYADFPAYFNPVSIVNALMGIPFGHGDPYYNDVDLENLPEGSQVKEVHDEQNGTTDTYVLVYTPHLALLAPIRIASDALSLTPLTEPVLLAIEPLVRLVVDMGYTDRTYENADVPTRFRFITPPEKIIEALQGVPGALEKGVSDATDYIQGEPDEDETTDIESFAEPPGAGDDARTAPPPSQQDADVQLQQVDPSAPDVPDVPDAPEPPKTPKPLNPNNVFNKVRESIELVQKQVIRPTLVSDGNKVKPTTTVGGGPVTSNGTANPVDGQAVTTPPPGGETQTPGGAAPAPQQEQDEAA